ncbi:MAG: nucleotide exchange factor GrpE [Planctomycetes bacterium]|nr:nucleotide exchange factor GrpE [Planctomycetota bacterium]
MSVSGDESQSAVPDDAGIESTAKAGHAGESELRAAEDATEPESPDATALSRQLNGIQRILDEFQGHLLDRLRYDDAKEKAFDRLYAELDELKKDRAGESLKPLLRDLTLLYDHIAEAARQSPAASQTLDVIREGLLEVLYRADVEPVAVTTGRFDRSIQYAARVVAADHEEQDWTVAEVLKDGFSFRGILLRPQHVVVRRFRPRAISDDSAGEGTSDSAG